MKEEAPPKKERTGISLDPKQRERLEKVAPHVFNNFSGFVGDLIDGYLAGQEAMQPDILVTLTRRLSGELDAQSMSRKMVSTDQRVLLRSILRDIIGSGAVLQIREITDDYSQVLNRTVSETLAELESAPPSGVEDPDNKHADSGKTTIRAGTRKAQPGGVTPPVAGRVPAGRRQVQ